MKLRKVTPDDDPFLLSVYASTRAQELAQVQWEPGQQEAFVKWQFELQRREYDAGFPGADYNVIEIDGQPAGRIWIGRTDEEIHLMDIALLPEFQNQGAGTVLVRSLIDEAQTTNRRLRHTVFVLNDNADRFYERLGFVTFKELAGYKYMEWKGDADD